MAQGAARVSFPIPWYVRWARSFWLWAPCFRWFMCPPGSCYSWIDAWYWTKGFQICLGVARDKL
jgi:hypothetical protein